MDLEFFANDDDVASLEAQLEAAGCARSVDLLVPVAWQLRQRNPSRAMALAVEAEQALVLSGLSDAAHTNTLARLQLIHAEFHWLHGDLDSAQLPLAAALAAFVALNDRIGMGDAEWLASFIWHSRSDPAQRSTALRAAQTHYAASTDRVRLVATQARIVGYAAFLDPAAARAQWQILHATQPPAHPMVQAGMLAAEANIEGFSGHTGSASRADLRAYHAACRCGNLERAISCANNAGEAFAHLNDLAMALEWCERALTLARQIGNPAQIAGACTNIGETLRRLNRPDDARIRLHESRDALAHLPAHPYQVNVFSALASLALQVGDDAVALKWAEQCEVRAIATHQTEYRTNALRQQARALGRLGRLEEALDKVNASLLLGQETGNAHWQMEALRVLAELHRQHALPAPPGNAAASPALHYMQQALDLAHHIEGFLVPHDLLEDAAADFAATGDTARAYTLALEAKRAQAQMHNKEASDRATTMHVRYEMERLHAETQHHLQLAETLRGANSTLEDLGQIGLEITASLNATSVIAALESHVHHLLDATSFCIYLLDDDGSTLVSILNTEAGQNLPVERIPLDDPDSNTARCARDRKEIVILEPLGTVGPSHIPGTLVTLSLMYAPLSSGNNLLGAMTIQSPEVNAYGEREVAILRTLCAYGAIALANARAIDALKKTQALLVQQEKLAALGSMVAGISHELNTPIGNALVMSTTLEHNMKAMNTEMQNGQVRRSSLHSFLTVGLEVSGLVTQSIQRATTLIAGFKQVAVDQSSEERRIFDLRRVIEDSTIAQRSLCARQMIQVAIEVPLGIECDSFPGPLAAIIGNLLQNCRVHAVGQNQNGAVFIRGKLEGDRVFVEVEDNGIGMSPHVLSHAFDPFFTTQLGKGGSGMGLSVAHRLAATVLAGELTATSSPGHGSTFALRFPRRAPFPL